MKRAPDSRVQTELIKRAADQSFRTLLGGPLGALACFLSLHTAGLHEHKLEVMWAVTMTCTTLSAAFWCRKSLRNDTVTVWRYRAYVGMAGVCMVIMPVAFHPAPNSRQATLEVVSVALNTIVLMIMTAADRPSSYVALMAAIGIALFSVSAASGLSGFMLALSAVTVFVALAPLIETVYRPLRKNIDLLFANEQLVQDLKTANAGLSAQVVTDSLTGLANRFALERKLEAEREVGILYLDLDYFKTVNDTHGHAAGDQVLLRIAETLKRCTREHDFVARLGGDEFVILLEHAPKGLIVEIADRICATVHNEFADVGISVSIGATIGDLLAEPGARALARADRNLYQAKQSGRNQVLVQ
jgi:diguanylate cyclase (GGDEF)-like protein